MNEGKRFPEKAQMQQPNDLISIIGNRAVRIAINAGAKLCRWPAYTVNDSA